MKKQEEYYQPLIIGLDIGIASVGWAVIDDTHIINLGVRCFDKAETADKGESLNLARRQARLARRRLRHRASRLRKVAHLLQKEGLISHAAMFKKQKPFHESLWKLRVEALDKLVNNEEWARIIYHICKHRGFYWTSKAEEAASDKEAEGGKVKKGLASTRQLMETNNFRTVAEMILTEYPDAQRNKGGDYSKSLGRELLAEELETLFKAQRELGNKHASSELEHEILGLGDKKSGLLWEQKPALSGDALLAMLGKCTFEKEEYRAPKSSFTAERHVWLTKLNNLRVVSDGEIRPLTVEERAALILLPYKRASDIRYEQLKTELKKQNLISDSFYFSGLSYPGANERNAKNPEKETAVKLPGWHALRKAFKNAKLEKEWKALTEKALAGEPETLDKIAWVLSVYKEDTEVKEELEKLDLPNKEKTVDALLTVRFDKFGSLSLKALYKILPFMEESQRYDQACMSAGYDHRNLAHTGNSRQLYLPPFYLGQDQSKSMILNEEIDAPRNPVVIRALNQARKVVNALIKEYGSPDEIHIELARDLSKPFDERKKIEAAQKSFRDRNEKDRESMKEELNVSGPVTGRDFEKWKLYREQLGKCAYSLQPIDIGRLFENGYVEVDHALPYSRTFDDSKNNRVLVFTAENRNKGNRTPYEYLDGKNDSEAWRRFEAFVNSNKLYRQAKRNRLLKKNLDTDESSAFRERNLNDTRYISRYFKNYVERYLQLNPESNSKTCVVLSGQLTAFLRYRWGLTKSREESDRHHALDATIAAVCTRGMVKRLSDYSRTKELANVRQGFVDPETGEIPDIKMYEKLENHFPEPWQNFRNELIARLETEDPDELLEKLKGLGTYSDGELESVKPLFVSRAPQRRNQGAAHKETVYAQPEPLKESGGVTQKVSINDLKLEQVDNLIEPHRNEKLYSALREWIRLRDGRLEEAKAITEKAKNAGAKLTEEEKERVESLKKIPQLRKPDKNGLPTGPSVKSVTMIIDKLSGIPVRGGISKNDTMIRVDLFRHKENNKLYLVPVYVHHIATGLPNRAIVGSKSEDEWVEMDKNYDFIYSIYPNDLVKISINKKKPLIGYYAQCDRSTGAISIWSQDRDRTVGKEGLIRSIGIRNASSIEKFHVDVIGNIYPAKPEERHELA